MKRFPSAPQARRVGRYRTTPGGDTDRAMPAGRTPHPGHRRGPPAARPRGCAANCSLARPLRGPPCRNQPMPRPGHRAARPARPPAVGRQVPRRVPTGCEGAAGSPCPAQPRRRRVPRPCRSHPAPDEGVPAPPDRNPLPPTACPMPAHAIRTRFRPSWPMPDRCHGRGFDANPEPLTFERTGLVLPSARAIPRQTHPEGRSHDPAAPASRLRRRA